MRTTRREFLALAFKSGAFRLALPSWVRAAAQDPDSPGDTGPVLVLLHLAGGNDGLNTVVRLGNDDVRRARPTLAIRDADALRLRDDLGLHPALTGLRELWDAARLVIVPAAGYPHPNRSHFRATEIWYTACDADRTETRGWIGRYFDENGSSWDAAAGVCLGRQLPQLFAARRPRGLVFQQPRQSGFRPAAADPDDATAYRQLNGMDEPEDGAGASIGALSGAAPQAADPLAYIEEVAREAEVYAARIEALLARDRRGADYPNSRVAQDLKLVAQLIAGGLPTRVYALTLGGFDTHASQAGPHARLCGEWGGAATAFWRDLRTRGQASRVTLLVFSEFGRRVRENGSGGTDHGAAGPLFVVGEGLRAGLHGALPSLAPDQLDHGDVGFTTDFRDVYATLLERRLGVPSKPILGRAFAPLPFA